MDSGAVRNNAQLFAQVLQNKLFLAPKKYANK
jgi:hypothetical protein